MVTPHGHLLVLPLVVVGQGGPVMATLWYEVRPRYTPGSPAMVPKETAEHVAAEERSQYEKTVDGKYGDSERALAARLGLRGIAWAWRQVRDCVEYRDLVTGETGSFTVGRESGIYWPWDKGSR